MMLADSLKAVISQALVPRRDGAGRIAAWEILRNTPNVAGLIREGKTFQIPTAIQTGLNAGMMLMDMSLAKLVEEGSIEPVAAGQAAAEVRGRGLDRAAGRVRPRPAQGTLRGHARRRRSRGGGRHGGMSASPPTVDPRATGKKAVQIGNLEVQGSGANRIDR